jgi:hypothetical protein
MNGTERKFRRDVPTASKRRKRPTSPWNRIADVVDQKKALRPNAAKGNAVAVPRCSGKFVAAVLIEAPKAEQLPKPVRKLNTDRKKTAIDPWPPLYARCSGKYPRPRETAPIRVVRRGPRVSVKRPMGIPHAYIPRLPAAP